MHARIIVVLAFLGGGCTESGESDIMVIEDGATAGAELDQHGWAVARAVGIAIHTRVLVHAFRSDDRLVGQIVLRSDDNGAPILLLDYLSDGAAQATLVDGQVEWSADGILGGREMSIRTATIAAKALAKQTNDQPCVDATMLAAMSCAREDLADSVCSAAFVTAICECDQVTTLNRATCK